MTRSLFGIILVSFVVSACAAPNARSVALAAPTASREQATTPVYNSGLVQVPPCEQDAVATLKPV